jgi:CheY-like chemotaxis protein
MAAPQPTILIAEDSDDIRLLLKMFLEMRGYRVVEAEHGQQAVERAAREKPDLILMDLSMPVLNGWEATRQLRQVAELRDTPIVALSAHCHDATRQEALDAGCQACVQKPVDDKTLDKILSQFLE